MRTIPAALHSLLLGMPPILTDWRTGIGQQRILPRLTKAERKLVPRTAADFESVIAAQKRRARKNVRRLYWAQRSGLI